MASDVGTYPRGFNRDEQFSWPLVRADKIVCLNYGKSLTESKRRSGDVIVYGTNGPCGFHDTPLSNGPSVILGRKGMGNLGVKWTNRPFWVIDTAYYVTPRIPDIDLKYFYYLIKYIGLNHLKDGTSNPSLSRDTFYAQLLPLPPLPEQCSIADILGTLDDKIELNRRMNRTLEEMARALFKSWFVDFDPVRAKAEGRTPAGMDPATAALFPDAFQDSPLGPIPKGWEVTTVGKVATHNKITVKPEEQSDELFDHYSLPAYDDGQTPVAEAGSGIKSNKFLVDAQSVLLSKLNPRIPRVWLPLIDGGRRPICSTEFLDLRPATYLSRDYLYSLFNSTAFSDVYQTLVTGTSGSHQRVKPEYLLAMDIVLPPVGVAEAFHEAISPLLARIGCNRQESQVLSAIRDTLLPKLLSGEIRVGEAQELAEGVV
jgi:type I restriction enzyme, S subunit